MLWSPRTLAVAALPCLVLAQSAGLLLADAGALPSRALLGVGLLAVGTAALVGPQSGLALALVAVAGASAGTLARRIETAASDRPASAVVRTLEGRVVTRDVRPGWVRLDLDDVVSADAESNAPAAIRLQGREADALADVVVGDRLRSRVVIEAPMDARNPGARDSARALARSGIGALARLVDPLLVARLVAPSLPAGPVDASLPAGQGARDPQAASERPAGWLEGVRERVGERLSREGPGGGLLRALACGDRASFAASTRLAFQELGLSHLLSVSGLHLVLVAGLAYAGAIRALRRVPRLPAGRDVRRPALGLALCATTFYSIFTGFGVPVQRSLICVVAAAFALARRRPLQARSALAAAAFVVLAARPTALFDAGAQMSFAATAALLVLRRDESAAQVDATRADRLRVALRGLLSTSAAATAATAPIAATHMGVIAPAGIVANLIFVPWTGAVLLPASLVAAALAAAPGDGAARDAILTLCSQVAGWTCAAVERLAAWLPDAPVVAAPGAGRLLACAALAVAATRLQRLDARLACTALSCLLLALARAPVISPEPPRAVFLDVGQGDSTLVQGREAALLVDAGLSLPDGLDLGRSVVLPALAALGVSRLDLLIVTHGDADHRGGVPAVLGGLPVGVVWIPPGASRDPAFAAIREAARLKKVPIEEVGAGDAPRRIGDLRVEPLWPPPQAPIAHSNDHSLVVRVQVESASLLLPGDVEAGAEQAIVDSGAELRSDVLKLGHHGSRTSTSAALLEAVAPRLAIASAPCAGRFGMPHPEVIERLDAAGVHWQWTGRDGAVLVGLANGLEPRNFGAEPLACTPGRRRDASPRRAMDGPGARSSRPGHGSAGLKRRAALRCARSAPGRRLGLSASRGADRIREGLPLGSRLIGLPGRGRCRPERLGGCRAGGARARKSGQRVLGASGAGFRSRSVDGPSPLPAVGRVEPCGAGAGPVQRGRPRSLQGDLRFRVRGWPHALGEPAPARCSLPVWLQ